MRLEIRFRGKKYSFSNLALIVFPLGLIISVPSLLQFVETTEIIWLQELFAKHVVFFLNLFFNLGAYVWYRPIFSCPWFITNPDDVTTYINNGCTGFLAMCIFVAVILFTPHSRNPKTHEDIFWRKTIAIIIAITLIYLYNVFRATIQIYLYSRGFAWSVIHDSNGMLAITVAFHIAIFLLCTKYVPEWFLSIFYSGKLIIIQFTKKSLAEMVYDIKHRGENEQYKTIRQLFRNEGLDLYLIKIHEIDLLLIQFLKNNKHKYTVNAIKDRLFAQQEKISENLLERILFILADAKWVLAEKFEQKTYYFYRLLE
ncbi:MAG: hypothetical protein ACFFHD_07330 [Promethearchaeota archaeon]